MNPEPSNQARRSLAPTRCALFTAVLAIASPAVAWVPPASAILKRTVQHRDEFKLASVEARGTIAFAGPAAERVRAMGVDPSRPIAASVLMKVPGRCRLELAPDGVPPAQRPAVSLRAGRVSGSRGLQDVGAARAMVEAVCALLGEHASRGDPERALVQRLVDRGVDPREVTLGRYQGKVAWVIGGRPQDDRPQAWIEKQSFDPVRLMFATGGVLRDVRFIATPNASERFPRTIEEWSSGQLEARFQADLVTPNPKLPDAAFP